MTASPTRRQSLQWFGAGLLAASAAPSALAERRVARSGWQDGPSLPFPVQEIYPALHKGQIHQAGGFVSQDGKITGPTAAHVALDLATGTWRQQPALPIARHHPQLVSLQGSLYCVGGFEADERGGWQMQSDMWRFNEAEQAWDWGPSLPVPNGESTAGVIANRLYLAGGRQPLSGRNLDWNDQADVGTLLMFDGDEWEELAAMPTPRNSATGGVIDGRFHVVAGRTVAGGNTAVHEVYDPGTDRWETLAPMPKAQGGLASGVVDGKLYTFGGEWFDNGGGVYSDAWVYDPTTDRWEHIPDMPQPRHGLGGVTVDNSIYLIGGALQRGVFNDRATAEIYTP